MSVRNALFAAVLAVALVASPALCAEEQPQEELPAVSEHVSQCKEPKSQGWCSGNNCFTRLFAPKKLQTENVAPPVVEEVAEETAEAVHTSPRHSSPTRGSARVSGSQVPTQASPRRSSLAAQQEVETAQVSPRASTPQRGSRGASPVRTSPVASPAQSPRNSGRFQAVSPRRASPPQDTYAEDAQQE